MLLKLMKLSWISGSPLDRQFYGGHQMYVTSCHMMQFAEVSTTKDECAMSKLSLGLYVVARPWRTK